MVLARPGQMRHRITVEEKTETVDPNTGVRTESWTAKYSDIPAAYRPLTSRELQAAGARNMNTEAEFELRADFDITAAMRIQFNGDVWEIDGIRYDETLQRRIKIGVHKGLTDG